MFVRDLFGERRAAPHKRIRRKNMCVQMKDLNLNKKPLRISFARGRKSRKADGKLVLTMAARGKVEDEIAQALGIDKSILRKRHIDAIKAGKAARAATNEVLNDLTSEEYHFLAAATSSFASDWFDPRHGNDLFPGTDGNSAKSILDAFAAWKQQGGKYNCIGLSGRVDPEKLIEFSGVAATYRAREIKPHVCCRRRSVRFKHFWSG